MIAKNYKHFVSTTTVAAMSGLALAVAYIATNQQEDVYLLVVVKFVAVACIIGWVMDMFLLALPALARALTHMVTALFLPKSYLAEDGPDWEMVRIRREMIALRIGADESVFCSKYHDMCNCNSFCGDSHDTSSDPMALAPGYLVSLANNKADPNSLSADEISKLN